MVSDGIRLHYTNYTHVTSTAWSLISLFQEISFTPPLWAHFQIFLTVPWIFSSFTNPSQLAFPWPLQHLWLVTGTLGCWSAHTTHPEDRSSHADVLWEKMCTHMRDTEMNHSEMLFYYYYCESMACRANIICSLKRGSFIVKKKTTEAAFVFHKLKEKCWNLCPEKSIESCFF